MYGLYSICLLERFPKGTKYPRIVEQVGQRMQALGTPAQTSVQAGPTLVVDHTGVGVAVVDLFEDAGLEPWAITITGGDTVTWGGRHIRVPKRELVTSTHVAMQTGRLLFAQDLADLPTLVEELGNFSYKISASGHDSYGAAAEWREGSHDDLVLAVALAVWYAEKVYSPPWPKDALHGLSSGRAV